MAPLRIDVNGSSRIYRPAERAIVSISIQSESTSQDEVLRDVKNTSAEVRRVLTDHAAKDADGQALPDAPITHWSNSSLSTGSYQKFGDDGEHKTRIHTAQTTFSAKFQDFSKLGSVATTLSTMTHVSITNIEWELTEVTKAKFISQCRHQAVQDAVGKAKDFAEALGRSVPSVTEVRDSGANTGGMVYSSMSRARRTYQVEAVEEELDFKPEDVSLNCSVSVTFEDK